MKIAGVVATYHKNGIVSSAVETAVHALAGKETEKTILYLSEYQINPCRACFGCYMDRNCVLNDDFNSVYQQIEDAEYLILGSPVYFGAVSGLLKNFIDRHNGNAMINPVNKADFQSLTGTNRRKMFMEKVLPLYKPKDSFKGKKIISIFSGNKPAFLLRLDGEYRTCAHSIKRFASELGCHHVKSFLSGSAFLNTEAKEKFVKKLTYWCSKFTKN